MNVVSAHLPDARHVRAVKAAARRAGKSPSAYLRDLLLEDLAKQRKECPTCGHKTKAA